MSTAPRLPTDSTGATGPASAYTGPLELFVCGWDEVKLWRFAPPTAVSGGRKAPPPETIWRWQVHSAPGLPDSYRDRFNTTDDCKPVDDGARLLITSSGGAACLVDRRENRVVWYARVPNAHSAEILPGNRVVAAASHQDGEPGDRLILYDLAEPERELWSATLSWGHGAFWESTHKKLWALDYTHLTKWQLTDWDTPAPRLSLVDSFPLPSPGGHELSGIPGSPFLDISAIEDAWRFDARTIGFVPHPLFAAGQRAHLKCIALHPTLPWLAYVRPTGRSWWGESVHLIDLTAVAQGAAPADVTHTIHIPGEHFYKVRWNR